MSLVPPAAADSSLAVLPPSVPVLPEEREQRAHPCLLSLQNGAARSPLFCFHPIEGHVRMYQNLVSRLERDLPVYGLQAVLPGASKPTLMEMCREYADAICDIPATGPCRLLGHSFGALVAMHTAALLEVRGRKVQFVGIVDNQPFDQDDAIAKQRYLADYITTIYEQLAPRISVMRSLPAERLRAIADQVARYFVCENRNPSMESMIAVAHQFGLIVPNACPRTIATVFELLFSRIPLIESSRLTPVNAPLFVWQASQGIGAGGRVWARWTSKGCEESLLPGNHMTVMKSPAVDLFAHQLNGILSIYDHKRSSANVA